MRSVKLIAFLVLTIATSLAQASEVKVLGNESAPFCGKVEGKPPGMAVEILTAATREGTPNFSYDFSLPWARSQAQVHEQTSLAIIPLTRTPEREAHYRWIAELFPNRIHLVSVGRAAPLGTLEEAKDLEIGVLYGSTVMPILTKIGFTKLQTVENDDINVRKLAAGRLGRFAIRGQSSLYEDWQGSRTVTERA